MIRKKASLMSRSWIAILVLGLLAAPAIAEQSKAITLKTQMDKVSYCMGTQLGKNFKQQDIAVNPDALIKGLRDVLSGAKPAMSEEEIQKTMEAFSQEMMKKQTKAMTEKGEKNKKEGEAFLADNKKKEGVVTLPSGLQYKILKAGTGKKPTLEDKVECHYKGTLINGTEFDSSYKRGQPATFPLKGVIPGWTEALQLMPVGSKWQLVIPAQLAYGEQAPPDIGPNQTLIFEVELLGIK